jgi:hypothetical protein
MIVGGKKLPRHAADHSPSSAVVNKEHDLYILSEKKLLHVV